MDQETLAQIAESALEKMAFIFVDGVEEPSVTTGEIAAAIELESDEEAWTLELRCAPGLAEEISANLLGVEEAEVTAEVEGREAVFEFANILGGEVVLALGGADHTIRLGLPHPAGETPTGSEAVSCRLCADSGYLDLILVTREPHPGGVGP